MNSDIRNGLTSPVKVTVCLLYTSALAGVFYADGNEPHKVLDYFAGHKFQDPVSYTHLDVYKRQGKEDAFPAKQDGLPGGEGRQGAAEPHGAGVKRAGVIQQRCV